MDVVYIVGNGSRWGNNELRYSLRSIEKFGIGLGRVFIFGSIPYFINRARVTCVEMQDNAGVPAKNVYLKIKSAIESDIVPGRFLISSDDHFFVRPTDFINYPIYFKSENMPTQENVGTGKFGGVQYTQGIVNTSIVMDKFGLGHVYFEGHTNKLYDKSAWRILDDMGVWNMMGDFKDGFSTNTPMAAFLARTDKRLDVIKRKDIKINRFASFAQLESIIEDTDCFSIGDGAIECGIGDYLQWMFPNKSKYEI